MNRMKFGLLISTFVVLAGCNQGTPGGPGVTNPNAKQHPIGQAVDTFDLSASLLPTTLKQGERIQTSIGIKRGNNFDEDVKLLFTGLPTGVKIEPSPAMIKHGDTEAKITLSAAENAAIGDFTIRVAGHPAKGADALINFKITVNKK